MTLVVRQAQLHHQPELLEAARTVHFINLPPFADTIDSLIAQSLDSTKRTLASPQPSVDDIRSERRYMFVLEGVAGDEAHDPRAKSRRVIGTSGITAGMGDEKNPNLSYQLVRVRRRSEDLAKQDPDLAHTGLDYVTGEVEHIVAQLFRDKASPTELGGLIVRKENRGRRHGARELPGNPTPGRVLSFVRFHFIARFRPWFSDVMLAEMLARLERYNDGNPFWRHFMRKFINLPYEKADRLSTRRREFMYRLLPDRVYASLLPDDVIDNFGAISAETERARRLLEEVGFRYVHRIDPFDAGPHLEASTDEVTLVRDTRKMRVTSVHPLAELRPTDSRVLSADASRDAFLAAAAAVRDEEGGIAIDEHAAAALAIGAGDEVWCTPLNPTPEEHEDFALPMIDLPALDNPDYDALLSAAYRRHAVGSPGRPPGPTPPPEETPA